MKRSIEMDLPPTLRVYEEIKFTARISDKYDAKEAAESLAEFLEFLYDYIPSEVMERVRRDRRGINFRSRL